MVMTRSEVEEIARETAEKVVGALHRYPIEYQEPGSVNQALSESMNEELTAAHYYRLRAQYAEEMLDEQTAALFREIAGDEDDHYKSFSKRLNFILPRE